jgi:hypothetical protein
VGAIMWSAILRTIYQNTQCCNEVISTSTALAVHKLFFVIGGEILWRYS